MRHLTLALALLLLLCLPATGWAAVAYISDVDKVNTTGSSIAWTSYAVSGSNPTIVLLIATNSSDPNSTMTVSSVVLSAGLTGGTPIECGTRRQGASTAISYVSIWAIPAPTGTGTITATLSASVAYQATAILMSGAHQTTPCASGDTVTAGTNTPNPLSVTPANLTANDAAVGMGANANDGDAPTFNQTSVVNSNSTAVNAAGGYHLGTGAVTVTWGVAANDDNLVGARIQAAAAGGVVGHQLMLLGVGP